MKDLEALATFADTFDLLIDFVILRTDFSISLHDGTFLNGAVNSSATGAGSIPYHSRRGS
jgi:hypothetical protein